MALYYLKFSIMGPLTLISTYYLFPIRNFVHLPLLQFQQKDCFCIVADNLHTKEGFLFVLTVQILNAILILFENNNDKEWKFKSHNSLRIQNYFNK